MNPVRPARPVRCLVALLTFLSTATAQFAVFDCRMPVAERTGRDAADESQVEHVHHGAGPVADHQASDDEGSTPQSGTSCTMPVGCGAAGVAAPRAAVTSTGPMTTELRGRFTAAHYTAVFLPHEPPPPRLSV